MAPRQIASDLDGTLIPLAADPAHDRAVGVLERAVASGLVELTYITGRHLALAIDGIRAAGLPLPARIFADVGTSLHHQIPGAGFAPDSAFRAAMRAAFGASAPDHLREILASISGLEPQADDRQAEFKWSYETGGERLDDIVTTVRSRLGAEASALTVVTSQDPVSGRGLVDVLPRQAGKARALQWLVERLGVTAADVLFAGDSGNDRAALLSGHPAVLVGNAPADLREDLVASAARAGLSGRLYCARAAFAAGVVEGAEYFKFI